jgi:putative ABC transport system permease protein
MDTWTAYRNPRFQTMVLGTLAFLALGLVALGIFAVIAFFVTIRTNEVGIRLALGAPSPSIVRLMVLQAVTPVAVGVLIGAVVTRWISRVAETQLYEVKTSDPVALAGSAVIVIIIAILASYLPARRASRVDPVVALRLE